MKLFSCVVIVALGFFLRSAAPALAEEAAEGVVLRVGDPAPVFEARDDRGELWRSSDRLGKKIVVVYFYPADLTGGCTKQACGYRDDLKAFEALGAEVVGVSGDSVRNHQIFKTAYKLNFSLLADPRGEVAKKFGVKLGKGGSFKKLVGGKEETLAREVTASRWTFVIDKRGKVAFKNTEVKAPRDSKAVLKVVQELGGLQVGDKVPAFQAKDDQGKPWRSVDHVGKKVLVVYFYPADMTGGCTKQACGFRDDLEDLSATGVEVIGVSGDSVRNHQIFKKAHALNFALLADPQGEVAKKFGVPLGKGASIKRLVEGKEIILTRGVTASRWTFVIDRQGKVAFRNTRVNAAQDSETIRRVIEGLRKKSSGPEPRSAGG